MADTEKDKAQTPRQSAFWDSTWALIFMIAVILFGRYYVLEPFKIPSGSMEPTLVGHEDFGDRIVTNKLAYVTAAHATWVILALAGAILFGFIASKSWKRTRAIIVTILLAAGLLGGMGFLWSRGAIAGEPQRFDVVVFEYQTDWSNPYTTTKKINYIKRCCGLPGDQILISGGNLYTRKDANSPYKIIRVWETKPRLQESLWYPVSKAWRKTGHLKLDECDTKSLDLPESDAADVRAQLNDLAFPWKGAETGTVGVVEEHNGLTLDGSAPVLLEYAYPVMNVHVKAGRWPFKHVNCPAAHLPGVQGPDGITFANPKNKSEDVWITVGDTWQGLQCPNCRQVMFPVVPHPDKAPKIVELPLQTAYGTPQRFLYGGDVADGDLRLDVELNVETPGKLTLDVGNTLHRSRWTIPGDGAESGDATIHAVRKPAPALTPGQHTLSLAWVDGTVVAKIDGTEWDREPIDIQPPLGAARQMQSLVTLKFDGFKGRVARLDLYRDLIHIPRAEEAGYLRQGDLRGYNQMDDTFWFNIPQDYYLMLGDNGSSSADSRVWGFVPRSNLVGRGSFIWWPPSRWQTIK